MLKLLLITFIFTVVDNLASSSTTSHEARYQSLIAELMMKYRYEAKDPLVTTRGKRAATADVEDISDTPTVFESTELPMLDGEIDTDYMATVGNGHLATTIYSYSIHVNGLYNGRLGVSHRARISSKNAIRVHFEEGLENEITRRYDLNVAEGIWYETMTHADFVVTVRIFAHRVYTRVLVTQFEFQSLGDREVTLTLINNEGAPTEDISFSDPVEYQFDTKIYKTMNGETKLAETPVSEKATVYVYYNELDNKITLGQTDNGRIHNYVTSIDQKNDVAKKEFDDVMGSINADEGAALLQAHIDAWSNTWNQGKIEVDDLNLGKIIYGSFYYILSSLPVLDEPPQPRNQFYGLSPGGLTRGSYLRDYQGHSFWDTETWMYPCIMMFFPTLGKDILSYRWLVREEAKQRAACNWHNGTRFPWESAFTGAETTPDCCYETRENQQHVTSDIAFAARQYLSATRDVDWLNDWGCEFLRDIAKYWQSRVTYNEERDAWEILEVMPSDEYHMKVDNSVYTNIGASLAIFIAEYAACMCGDEKLPDDWLQKARDMTLVFDQEVNFHPEFEGYPIGETVKQADVVLLGFPVMWPMDLEVRENDLNMYEPVTDPSGPAMTWGMFSIGHLELENYDKAEELFHRSYELYVRQPYKVWTEAQSGIGAINFITGMGGFLQAVFFGYGGFRLRVEQLDFNPNLLPGTTDVKFIGINYMESSIDFIYGESTATITLTNQGNYMLKVSLVDGTMHTLDKGQPFVFQRQSGIISAAEDSGCALPEDSIERTIFVSSPTAAPATNVPPVDPCVDRATTLVVEIYQFVVVLAVGVLSYYFI